MSLNTKYLVVCTVSNRIWAEKVLHSVQLLSGLKRQIFQNKHSGFCEKTNNNTSRLKEKVHHCG